ncbi:unnamed protein product [Dovyalis caffra]|uniref:Uncharacterized protein n=1 Tax=Dovyalis caffra TaxID=77055 RepID=A0AAV1RQC6_9ROSI|nr:unnamed protein product [Dovyalis caffra]
MADDLPGSPSRKKNGQEKYPKKSNEIQPRWTRRHIHQSMEDNVIRRKVEKILGHVGGQCTRGKGSANG